MRWLAAACLLGCVGCSRIEGQRRGDCLDDVDNDEDGRIDCDDPSCGHADRCQRGDTFFFEDTFRDSGSSGFPMITYNWDVEGLQVDVEDAAGSGFDLGLAETGSTADGWFGEDCFNGTAGFNICHGFTGFSARLRSLGDGTNPGDPSDVEPGVTTLLNQDLAFDGDGSDRLTYMITFDDGQCAVWGDDVSYYAPFACLEFQ